MVQLLKQTEAMPASYPAVPSGLSEAAAALDPAPIWQRIEAWVSVRWTPREVVWLVEGPGDWTPPLSPATVTAVERWDGAEWQAATLDPAPDGYGLSSAGPWRVTATVGSGPPPESGTEAYRRLAEYSAEIGSYGMLRGRAGTTSSSANVDGGLQESNTRPATWAARALVTSGAADLLRPYRRTS